MKKITILALCLILAVGVLAGCRGNVGIETEKPTTATTKATTAPTTQATQPPQTTQHTVPSETTGAATMPSAEIETTHGTNGTDATGRSRHMPPRY